MGSITIRPIELTDTKNIVKWRNSWSVRKNLFTQTELTESQHLNWMKNFVDAHLCYQFIIVEHVNDSTNNDIGTVFIKNIDTYSNKGEFGIFIGEDSARGKGYAKIATKQILNYAFEKIKLNRVYLTVFSDNVQAIAAYAHAGFVLEGELLQDFKRYDGYVNVTIMGITSEKWRGTNNDAINGES